MRRSQRTAHPLRWLRPLAMRKKETAMRRFKGMGLSVLMVVMAASLAAGVACSNGGSERVSGTGGDVAATLSAVTETARALVGTNSVGQTGLWVTGEGTVTMEPDLALLSLGVEATADTVAEARGITAVAMDAIVSALKARGLQDRDIQTRSLNIFPIYEYVEVLGDERRTSRQVLVGYRVSNTASVKIRDLDNIGDIIDEVAKAGGDQTRINGISFTVEDTSALEVELRESAVADALAKADHLASLSGVVRGRLVFLTQTGGSAVARDFSGGVVADFGIARALSAPSTPISGGELELTLMVQAVFEID